MAKIRVLVADAKPWTVPSFYRTVGPLLADPRYEVKMMGQKNLTWVDLAQADVFCLPRVATNDELLLLELAKSAKIPVWVDYDDNLLDVPVSNPCYIEYTQPSARQSILLALAEADLVTVSTDYLQEVMQPARPDKSLPVVVVRNGLNPNWPKHAATHTRSDTFYWRGSSSHIMDVTAYADAIAAGLPETATFQALGWFPWPLAKKVLEKTDNLAFTKELPINMFFRELENSGAACCLVPLEDNPFNRSKSNIAQLEAIAVGALAIVPDWPEWQLPGSIKYTDPETMKLVVANFMETPYEERKNMWEAAMLGALHQTNLAVEARYAALSALVAKPVAPPSSPPTIPRLQVVPPTYNVAAAEVLH